MSFSQWPEYLSNLFSKRICAQGASLQKKRHLGEELRQRLIECQQLVI